MLLRNISIPTMWTGPRRSRGLDQNTKTWNLVQSELVIKLTKIVQEFDSE